MTRHIRIEALNAPQLTSRDAPSLDEAVPTPAEAGGAGGGGGKSGRRSRDDMDLPPAASRGGGGGARESTSHLDRRHATK